MPEVPLDTSAIAERFRKLERQNRWMTLGLLILGLGFGAFILGAAVPAVPHLVAARNFAVVGADSRVRAELGLLPSGQPRLALMGASGKVRATIGLAAHGEPSLGLAGSQASLAIVDGHGRIRVALAMEADRPVFALNDGIGETRIGRECPIVCVSAAADH